MPRSSKPKPAIRIIGEIRTPYGPGNCPRFADESLPDKARLIIHPEYHAGLKRLSRFSYLYVLFLLDRPRRECSLLVHPPRAPGIEVGVFASRSPNRPSPIGLSVVRLLKVKKGELVTSALDAYDHTPLLDLKPYFRDDDCKLDSNNGWLNPLPEVRSRKRLG